MAVGIARRQFISALGGASLAWPLAARAQQRERMRRIGMLMAYDAKDPQVQTRNAAFLQGLQQLGWTVGKNVQIDYRWSAGTMDDTRRYAAELVALAPDVIFAPGSAGLGPALQATRSIPIVFALVPDPVGSGFVNSLARPGGNVTGFTATEPLSAGAIQCPLFSASDQIAVRSSPDRRHDGAHRDRAKRVDIARPRAVSKGQRSADCSGATIRNGTGSQHSPPPQRSTTPK